MSALRASLRWLGPLLLLVLIGSIGFGSIQKVWRGAEPLGLCAAAALNIVLLVMKTWRWRALLASQGIDLPAWPGLRHYTIGSALGAWTPGRVGDFSKGIALRRELGIEPGRAMASVIADRLLDAVALAVVAAAGVLWLPGAGRAVLAATMLAMLGVLAVLGLSRFFWSRLPSQIRLALTDLRGMMRGELSAVAGVTAATALITFLQAFLIARALGVNVTFWALAAATSAATLTSLVPISVAGLGTREAVMALLLSSAGPSVPEVVGFSLAQAAIAGGSLALLGVLAWMAPSGWTPRRAIP